MSAEKTENLEISPAAAIEQAKNRLEMERMLEQAAESMFDTIVANEVGPAFSLAGNMLGDFSETANVVHAAMRRARREFSGYDGDESPRAWILSYVAAEAVARSSGRDEHAHCGDPVQETTEVALHCLGAENRLAVILTDVLGMSDDIAARIARVDPGTIRRRVSAARSWLMRHLQLGGLTPGEGPAPA